LASHQGMELYRLLLPSLACLLALRGVASVRLYPGEVDNLLELASWWNNFQGSETWQMRYADCMALYGIACDRDGFVTDLVLQAGSFNAPIPDMISRLQHLTRLALPFCQLTGTLSESLFSLTSLIAIDFSGNLITGTIPAAFSRLTNLRLLLLGVNQLSGPIDPLTSLPQLQQLNLDQNSFNTSIPSDISKLTALQFMNLERNSFYGSIPSSMGSMAELKALVLRFNQLSGPIPDSFSRLHNLYQIKWDNNQLTGSIPDWIGTLSALKTLSLTYNALTGTIPASLASLPRLDVLFLGANHLSGSIPAALGDILSLQYLWLGVNQLSGSIPTAIGKLTKLRDLDVFGNQLEGTLPSTLQSLSKLEYFSLSFNRLSGPVELIIRGMKNVTSLYISNNQFSGRLPSPAAAGVQAYAVAENFFSHGQVKFSNCSAVTWNTYLNCLTPYNGICGLVYTQRSAADCAAFCGLHVGATGPLCGGHGYCSRNTVTGAGECVCDPNYMVSSSNTNVCVPGAARSSLASALAYVSLGGSASLLSNGSILLTREAVSQQGSAFASPAMRLFYIPDKRSPCGTELGFRVAFTFAMIPGDQGTGGDGLAFVVAAAAPGKGASVGLGGVGKRSVAVEFDSVLSVKHSDPNDNHVGVNVGGSPVSLASATAPLILNDAHTKHAWIHYDPTSGGTLRVFLSSDPDQPLTPTLTASVSLCSVLKPTASDSLFLFGFVALSGSQPQRHAILSWNFVTDIPSSL
ncbi:unnamed protein product, partial [Closterium sp. Naga37s-1]